MMRVGNFRSFCFARIDHHKLAATERHLGTQQNLTDAPNDRMGLTANGE